MVNRAALDRLVGAAAGEAGGDHRDPHVQDAVALLGLAIARSSSGLAETRGVGAAVYRRAWRLRFERPLQDWLVRTAARRRWFDGSCGAWRIVEHGRSLNAAYHALKLLAGGVCGRAQGRPSNARTRQHRCHGCGNGDVEVVWRSPTQDADGVAWCHGCRPLSALGLLNAIRTQGGDDVALAGRSSLCHRAEGDPWGVSEYGACPLCGGGEAGSEHLLQWCPAVQAVLESFAPNAPSLATACRGVAGVEQSICDLLHQAAYLHGTMLGRHCMTWRRAARVLAAYTRGENREVGEQEEDEDGQQLDWRYGNEPDVCPTWEPPAGGGCAECDEHAAHAVQ